LLTEKKLDEAKTELNNTLEIKESLKLCEEKLKGGLIDEQGYNDLKVFISKYGVSKIVNYRTVTFKSELAKVEEQTKRRNYLNSKYGPEKADKILNQEFYIGMTKDEVLDSKNSEPDIKETEVLKTKTKDIWVWGNKSSGDVFVFVDDKLERFKDR
jgi:hypothetical protein